MKNQETKTKKSKPITSMLNPKVHRKLLTKKELSKEIVDTKKLSKEEWHLKFLKEELEHKKNQVYETYLKCLMKYNPAPMGYSAIMAHELYSNELMRLMEKARKNNKSLMRIMFVDKETLTEEERIKNDIEGIDKLIKLTENRISELPEEIKLKIAHDAIEYMNFWLELSKYDKILEDKK